MKLEAPKRIGFSERNVPRSFSPTLVNKIGAAFGGHFPHTMMKMARGLTGKESEKV